MNERVSQRGPRVYDPEQHPALALRLCAKGATLTDLARKLGVARSTVILWMKDHVAFGVAVREGRESADERVEASLFKRAVGFRCTAIRTHVVSAGQGAGSHVEKTPVVEIYPPDVAAASLWLRNRKPDVWREKTEIRHSGPTWEQVLASTWKQNCPERTNDPASPQTDLAAQSGLGELRADPPPSGAP